ncbi:hypothetical protein QPL79_07545 [Ignisphaera sp. 4213-co]|uniref:Energy-coupling factor transporter transmembrane protein EcfT n=1 Tax=Ignisphaera cupida TaxID=3050454 RepID=A0ABD4ZA85_9CREN|nr:hypothetical protein [Ignisphaera sp. 4213-co]MDK6029215.1 hypothetical protein [Ignisphaera sp. 4213-co]
MIVSVVQEVLEYRFRASKYLLSKQFLFAKAALFIASIAIPLTTKLIVSTAFAACLVILVAVLGLRKTALYIASSAMFLYLTMVAIAFLLGGSIESVTKATILAASSLSSILLIASTTNPSMLRKWTLPYLFLVIFMNTLREVIDISTAYRAKGAGELRYILHVVIASMTLAIAKTNALADSLKARGIEVK